MPLSTRASCARVFRLLSERSHRLRLGQRALRGRDARLTRINRDRLPQGACGAFEAAFRDVMAVVPVMQQQVQVHSRVRRNRFPKDFDQLAVEIANLLGREFDAIDERHAAAEINGARDQRLFHRERNAAVTRDAGLVPDRLSQRLAEADADVFNRMMKIDVAVADGSDGEVEQTVLGEQRQHVIEEPDSRIDLGLTAAVEVEFQTDIGFRRVASDRASTSHDMRFLSAGIEVRCRLQVAMRGGLWSRTPTLASCRTETFGPTTT